MAIDFNSGIPWYVARILYGHDFFLIAVLSLALFVVLWAALLATTGIMNRYFGFRPVNKTARIYPTIKDRRSRALFVLVYTMWPSIGVSLGLYVLLTIPYRYILISLVTACFLQMLAFIIRQLSIKELIRREIISTEKRT